MFIPKMHSSHLTLVNVLLSNQLIPLHFQLMREGILITYHLLCLYFFFQTSFMIVFIFLLYFFDSLIFLLILFFPYSHFCEALLMFFFELSVFHQFQGLNSLHNDNKIQGHLIFILLNFPHSFTFVIFPIFPYFSIFLKPFSFITFACLSFFSQSFGFLLKFD